LDKKVVLVVDDVNAIVEELLTLLQLHTIGGAGAADLTAAIEVLERESAICVIVCDVRLDRESGLDIIELIERHPVLCRRKFHYLFVTGDQMQHSRLRSSADLAILTKPVQPSVLIETLHRMLACCDA
jgi:CheY-like chemotaxis protein